MPRIETVWNLPSWFPITTPSARYSEHSETICDILPELKILRVLAGELQAEVHGEPTTRSRVLRPVADNPTKEVARGVAEPVVIPFHCRARDRPNTSNRLGEIQMRFNPARDDNSLVVRTTKEKGMLWLVENRVRRLGQRHAVCPLRISASRVIWYTI